MRDLSNRHPRENERTEVGVTLLAYFSARCPIPYAFGRADDYPGQTTMEADCSARIAWARTMLHALWPVPAQNSGNVG
jgi:hypothetical protein